MGGLAFFCGRYESPHRSLCLVEVVKYDVKGLGQSCETDKGLNNHA